MHTKFLSTEWAQAATDALRRHIPFSTAIEGVGGVSMQFEVSDTPPGANSTYYLRVADGTAAIEIGTIKKADVSVTTDYGTAAAISKGDLNIQTAFFSGKLKVSGNLAKLMLHQSALGHLATAVSSLDVEF